MARLTPDEREAVRSRLDDIDAASPSPPRNRPKSCGFAYRLDAERKLSGGEISALAQRMADATDPADAALLRAAIVQGFYGVTPHA